MNHVARFEIVYVFFINFGLGAFLMSSFLFLMGMFSILNGSTPYEERKQLEFEEARMSVFNRFKVVFGSLGIFHFFVPFVPYQRPSLQAGYSMLTDRSLV